MSKRFGSIVLLGRPNAGKSTLLNALVGAKVAAVSSKPQTTRHRILGVATEGDDQMVFLDTPGIHDASKLVTLNQWMNKIAWSALNEADLVCYLVDVSEKPREEDAQFIERILERTKGSMLILGTKLDAKKKVELEESIQVLNSLVVKHADRLGATALILCSAKRPESVVELKQRFASYLKVGDWHYSEDALTDQSLRDLSAELIREQLFRQLGQELPYGCAVIIESYKEDSKIVRIKASIVLQRESHKGMVIGKGASKIKNIGISARESIEQLIDSKVHLDLSVKVVSDWTENPAQIMELTGLHMPDDVG